MALTIIVTNAGRAALVNAANTGTAPVTIAKVGLSATALTPSKTATSLPGEHKRIDTLSGDVVADDTIHLIVRDEGTGVFTVRSFALYLADGTLFAIYGQSAVIVEKSAQAMLLMAIDVQFADVAATALSFGNANFLNPPATTSMQGVVELATDAETDAGADSARAVTPKGVKSAVTNWINARFGEGAPSAFVKSLLTAASAVAMRGALGLKSAALKDEGAGNGLDADLLDGQQGSYYANVPARLGYTPANQAGDTFTGPLTISHNAPRILFSETDTAKQWYLVADGSTLSVRENSTANAGTRLQINPDALRLTLGTGLLWGSATIWHSDNDGAGSGLDADLLDGQDGSYYTNITARLGYTPLNKAGDVATGRITVMGNGTGDSAMANTASNLGEIEVRGNGTGAAMLCFHRPNQRAFYFGLDTDNKLKLGGWSFGANAYEIWHSGNDGAGSGLDADLLDGQQGSYYTNIVARLGYTPVNKAGDTLTGSLSLPYLSVTANGDGANIRLGDDAFIGDSNIANGFSIRGVGNWNAGFVRFGNSPHTLGCNANEELLRYGGSVVWHSGNDGAGSGLDADLLDGQDSSYYTNIPARLGYTPANVAGQIFTGIVEAVSPANGVTGGFRLRAPSNGGDAYFQVTSNNGTVNWGAFGFNSSGVMHWNGNLVWHTGNDGSGSGLDADLLDGWQLSDILPSGNLDSTGYCRLPNGLIMQWGMVYCNADSYGSITFPIQFPTACFHIHSGVATEIGNGNAQANCPLPYSVSRDGASFWNAAPAANAWWMAIGR
ncbi:phage tail protein [Sphingobium sp. BYY-5]|uniref:gp53-like domain-containing protein n=1 Tax=Sphingobium sp. BYY-5 TaxID=2926400 RepID=UPI001FA738D7|nr:phage tail protein [Sphingobium sp. BYY-5]MCI4588607.1 phage tail protein [Sphingobium sp. BYY-5]